MSWSKYKIEYPIKTSIRILYNRLSTPSGLSEWFADNVNIKNDIYTCFWGDSEEECKVLKKIENNYIRYQWIEDEGTEKYFEFLIQTDEMTQDISLIITDFAETEDEKIQETLLWNSQIDKLKKAIGI